ncbi:MAG: ABC transporter permease [Chitinophagaceae bacterium]
MLKNYFKIAWRRLMKSKLYSFINIIGLTTGITACVLIGLFIMHELSYDKFNKNADRIVRVTMDYGQEGESNKASVNGSKVGPQFARTFPAVKAFTRVYNSVVVVKQGETVFEEKNFVFADSAFFSMFSFPVLQGDAATLLNAPDKVVLTESMAKKYFGKQDPVGKFLNLGASGKQYIVSGVVKDVPSNSQIDFDFVASFAGTNAAKNEQWWSANYQTYLLLENKADIQPLQKQVTAYMKTVCAGELQMKGSDYLTYNLEPLLNVHLYSDLAGMTPNGSITTIYILAVIAALILLIACINYTNLATAQAAGRSGEVGLRKTFGANKKQLLGQFMGESLLLAFIALILGVVFAIILLPAFNQLTGKAIGSSMLTQPMVIGVLLVITFITGLFSGAYPAFVLSNSKLSGMLRSGMRLTSSGGGFRKTLIVFQFVISVFLIVCTIVVTGQMKYIQRKPLGYDKDHVVILPIDGKMRQNYEDMKQALKNLPMVSDVSAAYESPSFVEWGDGISTMKNGSQVEVHVNAMPVDPDFVKTMGVKIIAGEDFSRTDLLLQDTSNDYKNYRNTFMLNETAARALGWTPQEAVGKTIKKGGEGIVKAVFKDFHFASLHQPITPLVLFVNQEQLYEFFIKVKGENMKNAISSLQGFWKDRVPHRPFSYRFLDDEYAAMYTTEQRTVQLFTVFSTIAIVLACLGLLGLTAYVTVQRTKEIGIRKVLGASVANITSMIAKDFVVLVLVAIVIAAPVAWWAMNTWLQDFAYRISMSWWMFGIAGLAALLIAVVTVSAQAIKAAMSNPVKALKNE